MFVCAHGGVHMFRVSLFLHLLCLAARAEWQLYLLFMQRSLWSKPWADFCICVHVSSFDSSPTCCSYDFYFGVCMYGIFCINCVAGSFYLNILLWGLYYRLCLITCNISAPINQLNSCWTEGRVNFKNKRQCTTCSMWYPFNKSWLGFNTDKVIMQQHLRRVTSTRLLPAHLHLLTWIVTVYPHPPCPHDMTHSASVTIMHRHHCLLTINLTNYLKGWVCNRQKGWTCSLTSCSS